MYQSAEGPISERFLRLTRSDFGSDGEISKGRESKESHGERFVPPLFFLSLSPSFTPNAQPTA